MKNWSVKSRQAYQASLNLSEEPEVLITIDPTNVPYKMVNGDELASALNQKYGLTLQPPEIVKQLERMKVPVEGPGQMIEMAMTQERLIVSFTGGRFPTGGADFVTINQLSFGTESILANVSGLTVVAETLIAEEFETLWRAAGAIKSWSSKEVQESVQLESFGTHTKVDIGFDPLLLLDSKVRGYLQSAMRSIGPAMTSRSIYDKFAPPSNI